MNDCWVFVASGGKSRGNGIYKIWTYRGTVAGWLISNGLGRRAVRCSATAAFPNPFALLPPRIHYAGVYLFFFFFFCRDDSLRNNTRLPPFCFICPPIWPGHTSGDQRPTTLPLPPYFNFFDINRNRNQRDKSITRLCIRILYTRSIYFLSNVIEVKKNISILVIIKRRA